MATDKEQAKLEEKLEREYEKKHKKKFKLTFGDIIFNIFNYGFFAIFTFSCIFPFYYIFINTISSRDAVIGGRVTLWPVGFNIQNYLDILNVGTIFQAFGVTFARTLIGTALMVAATGLIGYLVTKDEMWNRKLWYRFIVITMYFNAGIIPWYMNMSMLGLTGKFAAYIIPGIVAPYNIILVKTYIESIPAELEESAFMDGAGFFTVFRKIIWPLSKPILATIAIFGAVGHWNSFTDSLMLMQESPELFTVQHLLYNYLNAGSNLAGMMNSGTSSNTGALETLLNAKVIKYTVSMVTIIPILLVYPFMQRYFEKGIMLGAVKG
ncbi:MAG: carbohydrate ABC transporter permease [Lachnospiraceae bacterium]|nr:carbohydrate ABC transporter permease [Lachnospiraceae bacterium]